MLGNAGRRRMSSDIFYESQGCVTIDFGVAARDAVAVGGSGVPVGTGRLSLDSWARAWWPGMVAYFGLYSWRAEGDVGMGQ